MRCSKELRIKIVSRQALHAPHGEVELPLRLGRWFDTLVGVASLLPHTRARSLRVEVAVRGFEHETRTCEHVAGNTLVDIVKPSHRLRVRHAWVFIIPPWFTRRFVGLEGPKTRWQSIGEDCTRIVLAPKYGRG
jgi:hypothetical protein